MKKIALISAIALSGLFCSNANAQILQIGLNLGGHRPVIEALLATPHVAINYSNADEYYYLPDIDAYYCIPEKVYYYNNGVNWVQAARLPGIYSDYDWRNARHYEVHARRPFLNADVYRERYNGRVYDWKPFNDHKYEVTRPSEQPRGIEHSTDRFKRKDEGNNNRGPQNNNQRLNGNNHFARNEQHGHKFGF